MSSDPKKLFVINAIDRKGVAEELNDYLEDHGQKRVVADDDDRLTDEICQRYADSLASIDEDESEDVRDEIAASFCYDILDSLGLIEEEDEEAGNDYCPKSSDHNHVPDPASFTPADGAGRNRGTDWIVDVRCSKCGRSGSVVINPDAIQW